MSEAMVIICRSCKYGIVSGAATGFSCSICEEPLQMTQDGGLEQFRQNPDARLLCNDCGLLYVHLAEAEIDHYEMSPHAKAQMKSGDNSPLARFLRKRA